MPKSYFLYIDILGFSQMVRERGSVREIYRAIDTLGVHDHISFGTIAFSDTLLVYSKTEPFMLLERQAVHALCKFAQELFYRLVCRNLHFRAYLTFGEFLVEDFKRLRAFYGEALVRAYELEKEIQCTGLFIDRYLEHSLVKFSCCRHDERCSYVYLMQSLDVASVDQPNVFEMSLDYSLAHDVTYLKNVYRMKGNEVLPQRVRAKHEQAWNYLTARHGKLIGKLVAADFDPTSICPGDWSEAMAAVELGLGPIELD